MIFIFDWGYETHQRIGPLSRSDVSFDLDSDMVWLVRTRRWFRAFFIPIVPTETIFYFESAKDASRQTISKEIFDRYRPLAELNHQVMNEELSDEDYEKKRRNMGFS